MNNLPPEIMRSLGDPLKFGKLMWPDATFYRKQVKIIYSVEQNAETFVVAGNKLGKDYTAGFICVNRFMKSLMLGRTCRIVTTSVAEHHLKVLWGEIGRWITTSRFPLLEKDGGPLVMNHMEIRRKEEAASKNPYNYLVGRVSAKGEGLAGHHADDTLAVGDEASGLDDLAYEMFQGWAKRMLIFGNPNPTTNFFYRAIKEGSIPLGVGK